MFVHDSDYRSEVMDPAPMTAEEESLKKNTDCIYFLASPLTCKKGALCEFRHSESARLNPRDCYYWVNGNCLNPKCGFRHPPLDGLKAHSVPSTVPAASAQIPTAISAKQSTPCIYFQKGHCLKAERCPFSHVTQQAMPHNTAKGSPSASEDQEALKKEHWSMKQCATQHNISNPFIDIVSKTPVPLPKSINGYSHAKNLPSKPSHVVNSNARSIGQNQQFQIQIQNLSSHEDTHNGLEPGEIVGEHYSGFDTNVSNSLKRQNHSDYERYTPTAYQKNHIERNDNKRNVSAAYERTHIEQNGRSAHDFYERKPHRVSSEMNVERSHLPHRRSRSPDNVSVSDLRYRLKQRKTDSSDSSRHRVSNESFRSSHIKDRISGLEKEREVSRIRGRLSPTRRHERVRRSSEEPVFSAKSRNISSRLSKREDVNDSVNFSGPKTLAELKGKKKQAERSHVQESVVRKAVSYEEIVETGPTFEGPKPLDVLLKKKRGEGSANSSGETNKINEAKENGKGEENVEETAEKEEEPTSTKHEEDNNEGESVVKEDDTVEEYEEYNMDVDGVEDQDLENFDGEYEEDYDEGVYQEEEAKLNDGDNDNDIDDEDEFARKIGLIFS